MLIFFGHLLLHVNLDPPEQEWPQHLVESLDQAFVVLLTALNHSCQRVGEPLFELAVGLEDVGHEEVHQRPQLHQAVLEGGACKQQAAVAEIERGQCRHLCECANVCIRINDDVLELKRRCYIISVKCFPKLHFKIV